MGTDVTLLFIQRTTGCTSSSSLWSSLVSLRSFLVSARLFLLLLIFSDSSTSWCDSSALVLSNSWQRARTLKNQFCFWVAVKSSVFLWVSSPAVPAFSLPISLFASPPVLWLPHCGEIKQVFSHFIHFFLLLSEIITIFVHHPKLDVTQMKGFNIVCGICVEGDRRIN